MLQAAEYGVPQSRSRVIFWASQPGYTLPHFPQPENYLTNYYNLPSKEFYCFRTRRSAPHNLCTLKDVVTDLAAFEWTNTQTVIPQFAAEREERRDRSRRIRQYSVNPVNNKKLNFIGQDLQPYLSEPLSEFQRKLRKGLTRQQLRNHVTYNAGEKMVERVCNIPLEHQLPRADYRYLPDLIKTPALLDPPTEKKYDGRYRRLQMDGIFDTCMTRMDPNGINGEVRKYRLIRRLKLSRYPDTASYTIQNGIGT